MIIGQNFRIKKIIIFIFFIAALSFAREVFADIRCYETNSIRVCHNQDDESYFYNTPANEVAYNVQTVRDGLNYWTIYHSESKNKPINSAGDSIKVGSSFGSYSYQMPANKSYKIWGTQEDQLSILYTAVGTNPYTNISGGANPMIIGGKSGDPYYYVFFLGVADDNLNRTAGEDDYRHYLLQARTLNFVDFEIKTKDINNLVQWYPFNEQNCGTSPNYLCRPLVLQDTNGSNIVSNNKKNPSQTQGLIGSMILLNGIYYYFYTDYAPNSNEFHLYYRTASNIMGDNGFWSAPTKITTSDIGITIARVAKAKGMDRWAVLYSCYDGQGRSDLCLQYTKNLNIIGAGGISSLYINNPSDSGIFNLGLRSSGFAVFQGLIAQHYWMTDRNGNLTSPDAESQGADRGGDLTWMELSPTIWPYGTKVYRAGWYIADLDTTPPSVPSGLTATPVSSEQINLSWTASTDIVGYKIYRNGVQVTTSVVNSYSDIGLSPATTYSYTVAAYDAAGNVSSQSSSISATTLASVAVCSSFAYSTWGVCQLNNTQTRTITSQSPSGCTGGSPILTQPCAYTPTSNLPYPNGSVVKSPDSDKIYLISNSQKCWLTSVDAFLNHGLAPNSEKVVAQAELDKYPNGPDITDQSIPEGALIRAKGGIDVYIVKYKAGKEFKRLILSPSVFNNYGHLKWNNIRDVDQSVIDPFVTADLVRAVSDLKVYKLYPSGDTGQKRWVKTADAFNQMGFDWDSIYEINAFDRDLYVEGTAIE